MKFRGFAFYARWFSAAFAWTCWVLAYFYSWWWLVPSLIPYVLCNKFLGDGES
ncbi:hypothetical protein ACAN107058_19040 [Paracidovorax anthurii]|uniref:Uncharacterized protein n=1 Tax=Paracidovorax anthurii TaxID=78229 RepID=A0A328ZMB8_9BURK|nr:hypothetical protein AX018_1001142 [Paracidovorax anthurii]